MRRFLLTMPLLLVFSLLFVELPSSNTGTTNTSFSTQTPSPATVAAAPSSQASAPLSISKANSSVPEAGKTQLSGKKVKSYDEVSEDESKGEDD